MDVLLKIQTATEASDVFPPNKKIHLPHARINNQGTAEEFIYEEE